MHHMEGPRQGLEILALLLSDLPYPVAWHSFSTVGLRAAVSAQQPLLLARWGAWPSCSLKAPCSHGHWPTRSFTLAGGKALSHRFPFLSVIAFLIKQTMASLTPDTRELIHRHTVSHLPLASTSGSSVDVSVHHLFKNGAVGCQRGLKGLKMYCCELVWMNGS